MSLLYQYIIASLIILKDTFTNRLKGSKDVQEALERIDQILVPATHETDGLMSSTDKVRLDDMVDSGGIGHITLTSGYGTYTYESNSIEDEYTIVHNLNSYNLTVNVVFLNEEGYWETEIVNVTYLDENRLYFKLLEAKEVIVNIMAVEYFFSYRYESIDPINEVTISHNLKSFNLLHAILVQHEDGLWYNDIARIQYIDQNTVKVSLVEASPLKITMIRI